jgi:DNA-directed RNA polymerase subunit RPC12/RpoP
MLVMRETERKTKCPSCKSRAVYRYGKLSDRQRYICMICGRQFIEGHERGYPENRPFCSICGKKMYIYRRGANYNRYRCSGYPVCKNFLKMAHISQINKEEGE